MENGSETLMLSGVTALCADCGGERLFVPDPGGWERGGGEFCCTSCDAAVFLLEVLQSTGTREGRVA